MSLPSFAGNMDSTRKDTCCTTASVKAPFATAVRDNAPAVLSAAEFARATAMLQQNVVDADAEITIAYVARYSDHSAVAHADALTDLEVAASAALGDNFNKTSAAALQQADQSMTALHKKDVSLDAALGGETLTKMLIASDKTINQHFIQQYGMEVASSK